MESLTKGPKFPLIEETLKRYKPEDWLNQNLELINFDLIDPQDPDREIVQNKVIGKIPMDNLIESKCLASFIGLAIGDALGAHTEAHELSYERNIVEDFEDVKKINDDLRCSLGQYTDDTCMSLCIADSLLLHNQNYDARDLRHRFFLWWISGYNSGKHNETIESEKYSFGIGNTVASSFTNFLKTGSTCVPETVLKRQQKNGNGTIMRIAPISIGFWNQNVEKALEYAKLQSYTTHDGDEAAECSRLLTFILHNLFRKTNIQDSKNFLETIGDTFKSDNQSVQCLAGIVCNFACV